MDDHRATEAELRRFIDERVDAVTRRDAAALLAMHADDVTSFPVLPPSTTQGSDAVAQALEAWLSGYSEGPTYAIHGLQVEAGTDLGTCSFRYHVTGVLLSGDAVDMWVRATLVVRRGADGWRIVHQHESVPFDPESGLALVAAGPDD